MERLDCLETNPARPVDCRWRRAQTLHERRLTADPETEDQWISLALKFLDLRGRCSTDRELERLASEMPDIFWAHRLWTDDDPLLRWELEARLLTSMTFEAIAEPFAASASMVEAYEALFYQVRSRLQASAYIHHVAIGAVPCQGLSPRQVDVFWKLFAYHGGPAVLDDLIAPVRTRAALRKCPDIPSVVYDSTRGLLEQKSILAAWTTPLTQKNCQTLMRRYVQFRELELRTAREARRASEKREAQERRDLELSRLHEGIRAYHEELAPFIRSEQEDIGAASGAVPAGGEEFCSSGHESVADGPEKRESDRPRAAMDALAESPVHDGPEVETPRPDGHPMVGGSLASQDRLVLILERVAPAPVVEDGIRWILLDAISSDILGSDTRALTDRTRMFAWLKSVKERLLLPVVGIITDVQGGARDTLAQVFPGVPHLLAASPGLRKQLSRCPIAGASKNLRSHSSVTPMQSDDLACVLKFWGHTMTAAAHETGGCSSRSSIATTPGDSASVAHSKISEVRPETRRSAAAAGSSSVNRSKVIAQAGVTQDVAEKKKRLLPSDR